MVASLMRGILAVVLGFGAFTSPASASGTLNPSPSAFPVTAAATLVDPNSHAYVGTFVEDCNGSTPPAAAYLAAPFDVAGGQTLAIEPQGTSQFDVSVTAQTDSIGVGAFGGPAQDGCLAVGSKVSLVSSPLHGLLIVIGSGILTAIGG